MTFLRRICLGWIGIIVLIHSRRRLFLLHFDRNQVQGALHGAMLIGLLREWPDIEMHHGVERGRAGSFLLVAPYGSC